MAAKPKKTSKAKSSKKAGKPSLTKKQMRIAIAKDVIAQLEAKKIIATPGSWTDDPKLGSLDDFADIQLNKSTLDEKVVKINACDYVNKLNKCQVCALGSLFVSSVSLYNGVSWNLRPDFDDSLMHNTFENIDESPLLKYFSREQLALIESTFENNEGALYPSSDSEAVLSRAFYGKYRNDKDRLIGIMKNIINNDGTFDPRKDLSVDDVIEVAACYI